MNDKQLAAVLTAIASVETRCRANSYLIAEILKRAGAKPESLEKLDSHFVNLSHESVYNDLKKKIQTLFSVRN